MLEILIQGDNEKRDIALVENGNLIEYYEEDNNIERNEGNIYIGIIKDVIEGMQAAFVDIGTEKNSFIHIKDILPKIDETVEKYDSNIKIKDIVKKGKKILVQVKKDSNEKKGARVSTHINLPGKYIALMPNTDIVTISQKIVNEKVGHAGTLDPLATGVLPILIGKGTLCSKYLINHDKIYETTIQLGKKTDTADSEGNIIEEKKVEKNISRMDKWCPCENCKI